MELKAKQLIVAIGVFDGVHLGHKELLKTALELRTETGLPIIAVTFSPHPKMVLDQSNGHLRLLTPEREKQILLEGMGIDYYWAIPFTQEVARLSAEQFVEHYLCTLLKSRYVVCGFNFTFGYMGRGTPEYLQETCEDKGFEVVVVPPFEIRGEVVSSTKIRKLVMDGDVKTSGEFLGRPYCIYGEVVRGSGVGGRIGVPTSNVHYPAEKLLPKNGVYSVLARVSGGNLMPAVCNIGVKPTFGGVRTYVEVHIPGFSGELYGAGMQVFLARYIREERKFPSIDLLKEQIQSDIETALCDLESGETLGLYGGLFTLLGAYDRIFSIE